MNYVFLCPDGHEECKINPAGFQWFDLTKDDPSYILEESKKAETKLQKYIVDYLLSDQTTDIQRDLLGILHDHLDIRK